MNIPGLPNFDKITFGPGVVGRAGPIVGVAIICLTILAASTPVNEVKIAAGVGDFILVMVWLFAAFRHADKNPSTSVMEGGEAVSYYRQQMMASGFQPEDLPPEMKEVSPPPAQLASGGAKNG